MSCCSSSQQRPLGYWFFKGSEKMPSRTKATTDEFILTGRHVAMMFAAFAAVVVSVNAFFIYNGITTFPGLVVEDYYERGRDFNDTLAKAETQSHLGWRSQVSLVPQTTGETLMTLIMDHPDTQEPLSGLKVEAHLKRPIHDKEDRIISLTMVAPGVYAHTFDETLSGRWLIDLKAMNDQADLYEMTHKALVKF